MLSEETLEKLSERLVSRIELANAKILKQIGESIKKVGTLKYSEALQLEQMIIYGGEYNKIIKMLENITSLNVKEIDKIFDEVAKYNLDFSKKFYEYKNKQFIPYESNTELKNVVEALKTTTKNEYINLMDTRMIGFTFKIGNDIVFKPLKEAYIEVLDEAILNVYTGQETFDNAFINTLKRLGNGLVTYDSGTTRRLDSAVRMNMNSALTNLHNQEQMIIGKQFGADGVEVSVHKNPAEDHKFVQGKQFSIEEFNNFQNDRKATSYDGIIFEPEIEGNDRRSIGEYNCYHYIFSILLGEKPAYTNEELQEIIVNNDKGFEYEGKHYTNYEGQQLQRRIETEIRKQKDTQILAKASGNEELLIESQTKINQLTYKYNKLCKVSGLQRKASRLRVSGYRKTRI